MGDRGDTRLKREVLPPQKPQSGIGVMVVAATAMFFAVASSAFILRARMANRCPSRAYSPPVTAVEVEPVPSRTVPECGKAHVTTEPDGKKAVYFTVCPPGATSTAPVVVTPIDHDNAPEPPRGIEVLSATPANR